MNITIENASENDLDEIVELKFNIWNKMEHQEWYIINTVDKDFMKRQLDNDGLIVKAIADNKIVGFLVVMNGISESHEILKITNLEGKGSMCIEMANGAIDSEYRGHQILNKMIKYAEDWMLKIHDAKYILATVHPDNIASKKSLLNNGYTEKCQTKMYQGKDRCVMIKYINN